MIAVPASRWRLGSLAAIAFLCCLAAFWLAALILSQDLKAGLNVTYFPDTPPRSRPSPWVAPGLFISGCLFFTWASLALLVVLRMPHRAYGFDATGLYIGAQSRPAFTWADVKGATLMRGKRRSAVALILADNTALNTAGLLPSWLATFLGRPTDQDFALTNMDTSMALGPFLDLIQTHLDTYGQVKLTNLSHKES